MRSVEEAATNFLGGLMGRNLALAGAGRPDQRAVRSVACLAFVIFLSIAFWAGALWIAEFLIRVGSLGY